MIFLLLLVIVAIVVFVVLVTRQPDEFQFTRQLKMKASPAKIFAQVNDLHKWDAWSPWAKLDPTAANSFAGPEEGAGASMSWDGNAKVGKGTMTIIENQKNSSIKFKLNFLKPMRATNYAEFSFIPQGDETLVTWTMKGHSTFIGKAMNLVMDCEKMVGGQFEQGLTSLKAIAESQP